MIVTFCFFFIYIITRNETNRRANFNRLGKKKRRSRHRCRFVFLLTFSLSFVRSFFTRSKPSGGGAYYHEEIARDFIFFFAPKSPLRMNTYPRFCSRSPLRISDENPVRSSTQFGFFFFFVILVSFWRIRRSSLRRAPIPIVFLAPRFPSRYSRQSFPRLPPNISNLHSRPFSTAIPRFKMKYNKKLYDSFQFFSTSRHFSLTKKKPLSL